LVEVLEGSAVGVAVAVGALVEVLEGSAVGAGVGVGVAVGTLVEALEGRAVATGTLVGGSDELVPHPARKMTAAMVKRAMTEL
jgi:hypothetical protein